MASVSQWTPFGVALDISATVASVTRTSATQFAVNFNVSWNTHWDGAETNYGMKATSNGYTTVLNKFGNYATKGSGTLSAAYSISGNGAQTKSLSVTFINWEENWEGGVTAQASYAINNLSVNVPAWTSYTVSYNANGGSGAPGSQTKWKDQTLTLSTTKPSRTGYTFVKWNTKSDGSGTSYNPGAGYTANGNVTLYAIWTPVTYIVTYNANGGTLGSVKSQTKTYGVTLKLTGTATRTNYNFLGWSTNKSATTATYTTGSNFTTNGNTTLYAVWELAYVKPRINGLVVERCTSDGVFSDDGTCAVVNFGWATDWNVSSITIQWKSSASGASWTTTTVAASGRSGSVNVVVGDDLLDTDHLFEFIVTVADGNGSFSNSDTISSALYPIDVLKEGKGVAIGKAAELEDRFDVNFESVFRKTIDAREGTYIPDLRNEELTPDRFGSHNMHKFFHQGGTGSWKTILNIHGWTQDYDTTQIACPADQLAKDRNLKYRCGARDSGWSPWYTLLDNVNFYRYIDALGGFRFNHTWVGLYNSWTDAHNNKNRKGWIGHDGKTDLTMTNEATGHIYLSAGGKLVMLHSTYFSSGGNDQHYLGLSANKWKAVYAVSGTIVTSDRNQKTNIKPIEQKYIDLFDRLQPVTFTFKGSEHDRVHVGFISQDVEQAMKELDISAEEFAAFCRDVKMEKVEVVDEETGEKSEKDVPVKDENGNPVYLYSLRYTEFIALNTRMIQENRRKIAEQQTEIDELKREIAEIKALLKGDQHATSN